LCPHNYFPLAVSTTGSCHVKSWKKTAGYHANSAYSNDIIMVGIKPGYVFTLHGRKGKEDVSMVTVKRYQAIQTPLMHYYSSGRPTSSPVHGFGIAILSFSYIIINF
jgi:hypothetical protein